MNSTTKRRDVDELLTVRGMSAETRSVDVVASTDCIDSYGEVVSQSWNLERYRKNPVVLFGHNSKELPIGVASNVAVRNGRLEATLNLVPAAANPLAEQVLQGFLAGSLRAVSVGFVPGTVTQEKRNGKDVYVLSNNELHEISVVPIPANPEALARMKAAGGATPPMVDPGAEALAAIRRLAGTSEEERAAASLGRTLAAPAVGLPGTDDALAVIRGLAEGVS